jgi:hypothetical protein
MVTDGDQNKRMPCPNCNSIVPMGFCFPAPRPDPCEELNAWRFQKCRNCGWLGNVTTRTQYDIARDLWAGWRIDGRHWDTLKEWFTSLELC